MSEYLRCENDDEAGIVNDRSNEGELGNIPEEEVTNVRAVADEEERGVQSRQEAEHPDVVRRHETSVEGGTT